MTNYIDHHASSFIGADNPVHAGITRQFMQDNLTAIYENCGYDYTCVFEESFSLTTSLAWISIFRWVIPVYSGPNGWHDVDITMNLYIGSGTGVARVFWDSSRIATNDDNEIDEYTTANYDQLAVASGWNEYTFTASFDAAGTRNTSEYRIPVIFTCFAMSATTASSGYIQNVRIQEIIP